MATKIYFIAGPEAAYKEKVIADLTNMYFTQGKSCITKYKAARIDNLNLYGTLPNWAIMDRVDSLILNSMNTADALIVAGWHINQILTEVHDKYDEATIIFVRSSEEDPYIKSHMVYTVGEEKSDEIIAEQNSDMNKFITDNSLSLEWHHVSKETATRMFTENGTINSDESGPVEIAILGSIE